MIFLLLIVITLACSKAEVTDVQIPEIWKEKVERGDALYSKDQSGGLMPEVGNGYLATVVDVGQHLRRWNVFGRRERIVR